LLNNTIFIYNAVTVCVLVVANRGGKILNGATATNAVFSTNVDDPSVLRTAGVAIIPGSASPPINRVAPNPSNRSSVILLVDDLSQNTSKVIFLPYKMLIKYYVMYYV
jgi:hypothetical protein